MALGSTTYGYCASIISTTLAQPSFISYFDLDTRSNAADLIGAIFGLFQTGGFFGTLSCLKSADWLGRRKALFYSSLVTTVGGALQAGSVNIGMYIFSRFLTGVGIGTSIDHTLYHFATARLTICLNRCSRHTGAAVPERDCSSQDPWLPRRHARRDAVRWVYSRQLGGAGVLLCQRRRSSVETTSCNSGNLACAACRGSLVPARITSVAYVSACPPRSQMLTLEQST